MSYSEDHTEDDCDKCLKRVGKENLHKVPFIYKDHEDTKHPDLGNKYRQYYECEKCYKKEMKLYYKMSNR